MALTMATLSGLLVQLVDEAPVDLEGLDGKALQVAERGVAGSEVVDLQMKTEIAKRLENQTTASSGSRIRALSVISSHSRSATTPESSMASATRLGNPGSASCKAETLTAMLRRAGPRGRRPEAVHAAVCRQASFRTQMPQGNDETTVFGQRDELAGREQPPGGVLPAHQRLHPDQCLGVKVDDGLIVELQLVALEGPVQLIRRAKTTDHM